MGDDAARLESWSELGLIEHIRTGTRTRNSAVRLGIGDDCAILRVKRGEAMVVTTDFTLESRHFRRDWHTPESAGHRCLARGISDIAAMGARPLAAFLSLALPVGYELGWVTRFMAGFQALAAQHGVELAGGDTAEAPGSEILADVMVVGAAPAGRALRRSTAKAGDLLYVTGTLGGSAAELAALAGGGPCPRRAGAKHPQSFPEPRVAFGQALLRRRLATACMDLSDGLSSDLAHLCRASGVGAEVEEAALPLAVGATLAQALDGGEDYELLFAASPATRVPRRIAGVAVSCIGRLAAGRRGAVFLRAEDGKRRLLKPGGWEHFGRYPDKAERDTKPA